MLVNPKFIPEPPEVVNEWINNLKKANYSDEQINEMDIDGNYHIPDQLTPEQLGRENTTGFFHPKFELSYQSVSLANDSKIIGFPDALPVILDERMTDESYQSYDGSIERDKSDYEENHRPLYKSYGFVQTIEYFLENIANQLEKSQRKFMVTFRLSHYREGIFDKNGRLHHQDHEKVVLNDGDDLFHFHIYELVDGDEFLLPHQYKAAFLMETFHADSDERYLELANNLRNKPFVTSLNLKIDE